MRHQPSTFRYRVYNGLLLLAVVVVMGTSLMSLRTTSELQASVERASTSQQVLEQIQHFWGLLGDTESHGLRFVISGQEQYLIEWRHAIEDMNLSLERLETLTADNPEQRARARELRRLHMQRAQYGASTQELRLRANRGDRHAQQSLQERTTNGVGPRFLRDMKEERTSESRTPASPSAAPRATR